MNWPSNHSNCNALPFSLEWPFSACSHIPTKISKISPHTNKSVFEMSWGFNPQSSLNTNVKQMQWRVINFHATWFFPIGIAKTEVTKILREYCLNTRKEPVFRTYSPKNQNVLLLELMEILWSITSKHGWKKNIYNKKRLTLTHNFSFKEQHMISLWWISKTWKGQENIIDSTMKLHCLTP